MGTARVGIAFTGSSDAAANSIATSAKDTTGANGVTGAVGWETSGPSISAIADTAGNTYAWTQIAYPVAGEPSVALYWSTGAFTSNAANVVTVTFSAATATYRRVIQDAWSGYSATVQDTMTATGASTTHATPALTTASAGLVYGVSKDFTTLGTTTPGGRPRSRRRRCL